MLKELDLDNKYYFCINDILEPIDKSIFDESRNESEINLKLLNHFYNGESENFIFLSNSKEMDRKIKSFNKNMKKDDNFLITFPLFFNTLLEDDKLEYAIPSRISMMLYVDKKDNFIECQFEISKFFNIGEKFIELDLEDFPKNDKRDVKKFKNSYRVNICDKFKKFDELSCYFVNLFLKDISNANLFITFVNMEEHELVGRVDIRNLHKYIIKNEKDIKNIIIKKEFE